MKNLATAERRKVSKDPRQIIAILEAFQTIQAKSLYLIVHIDGISMGPESGKEPRDKRLKRA